MSCAAPDAIDCTGAKCSGGNSPFTNVFPINGLSANGNALCNPDNIQLMPASLAGGGCGSGSTLDIDDSDSGARLIGRRRGSGSPCEGSQLAGASFVVRSASAALRLTIAKVETVEQNGHSYEGYLITDPDGEDLCQYSVARSILTQLGFKKEQPDSESHIRPDGAKPEEHDDFVIAMGGPLFDANTSKPLISNVSKKFFNLACVGDALAQTYFLQDNLKLQGDMQATSAVLHMITANYCGYRMTIRGMKFAFQTSGPAPQAVEADSGIEAQWGRNGKALCIGTPRLTTLKEDGKPFQPQDLPASLQPDGCKSKQAGKCNTEQWIAKLRSQCKVPVCPDSPTQQVFITSWVESTGQLHLEKPAAATATTTP
jgi:hypothetical protein